MNGRVRTVVGRAAAGVGRACPGLADLRGYDRRRQLRPDLVAGVSVAAVAIPASLGMGELVGVSPVAGLYATLLPLAGYALFGSSRQLIVGPEGTLAALAGSVVAVAAAVAGDEKRLAVFAAGLALVIGAVQVVAGLCRLGFLADLLSKPVLLGYLNGVAVIVITGQLGNLLGITVDRGSILSELAQTVRRLPDANLVTVALSVTLLAAYVLLRRTVRAIPASLVVVVLAGLAAELLHLGEHGVALVGPIARGLPTPAVPTLDLREWAGLLLPGAGLALVGFADGTATARTMAARHGYEVDPNRELIGLGAGNLAAGLTRAIPVGSSGSRTAVADAAGSTSTVALLTAAAIAAIVTAFARPLVEPLPKAALGVVVVTAAVGLFTIGGVLRLRRVHDAEALLAAITMLAVLVLGIIDGLGVAVALSLGIYVYRSVRPHDAVLGAVSDVDSYRDVSAWPTASTRPGLVVYRFDAPLYFANAPYLKRRVTELVEGADEPVRWLLFDAESVTYLDATAAQTLRELHAALRANGTTLAVARLKAPLRRTFTTSGLTDVIGARYLFPTVRSGVAAFDRSRYTDS